jgi:hypothetical protein
MAREPLSMDISDMPEIRRLAEEVRRTRQPRVLTCDGQEVARLTPVQGQRGSQSPPRRRRQAAPDNSGLLSLVGIARSTDGVTDVSENKHKYLAEAYYAEFHQPAE